MNNKIYINKMLEYNLINATTGGDYVLNKDFQKKVVEKLGNLNCIANNCLDVTTDAQTGIIPVLSTTANSIPAVTENISELSLTGTSIKQVTFNVKEYTTFVAVNNTILNFAKDSFTDIIALYFAKCLAVTLNKLSETALSAGKTMMTVITFNEALLNICFSNPSSSRIFVNASGYSTLEQYLDDGKLSIKGVPVIVIPDLVDTNIILIDGNSALAHIHNTEMKISVNTGLLFSKNQTMFTLKSQHDLVALDTNSYKSLYD